MPSEPLENSPINLTASIKKSKMQKHMSIHDFSLHYSDQGQGSPIICLQGLEQTEASPLLTKLAADHRVITIPLAQFCESSKGSVSFGLDAIVDVVIKFVTSLAIEKFDLCSLSFGSSVALHMTKMHPAQIRTLILISPQPVQKKQGQKTDALKARDLFDSLLASLKPSERSRFEDLFLNPIEEGQLSAISQSEIPTLILVGTKSLYSTASVGADYKTLMPKSNLVIVYDAGDTLEQDRPKATIEVIHDYLVRHDSFLVTQHNGLINP